MPRTPTLRPDRTPRLRPAFTLVELLVVITIIVVLLALLLPAMGKAVYQATLAQCGAIQKVTTTAVIGYTLESKRHYPHRGLPARRVSGETAKQANGYITPRALARPADSYDIRPSIRPVLSVNQQLRCPFTEPVELDRTEADVAVDGSYSTFWDWRYDYGPAAHDGMNQLGQRWSWTESGRTRTFNLLMGDFDIYFAGQGYHGTHPDRDRVLFPSWAENGVGFGMRITYTVWWNAGLDPERRRGLIDMNHAFDDGSVRRYDNVVHQQSYWEPGDERMDIVPLQVFNQQTTTRIQVPRQ